MVKSSDLASNATTYSGPTYVAIRSAKHTGSSAYSHLQDMKRIRSLPEFAESFKFDETEKKIMIVTVDGGPDENPRYQKTICFEDYQLDALFLATNAPGRSAFNRTERRMAPLSHEMSGLILPHETFGSHLDGKEKTIDDALELKKL